MNLVRIRMFRNIILYLLLFLCLSASVCHSQQVIIRGKADSSYLRETGTIYAHTYDDYISYREKELAQSPLDPKGSFQLSFPVTEPTYIFLTVDNARAEMVVEPGKTYFLNFLPKDTDAVGSLSASVPVEVEFAQTEKNELNFLIADFSVRYETMLEDYRGNIARKEPAIFKKIDTLETLFKKKYAAYNKPYLDNYIYYTFASLEESITLENKESVYKKHIRSKPVQLNDHSYMTFFSRYFSVTASYFMSNARMTSEVNSKQNFASILEFFKQSKLLDNDTIREAVILKSLAEYFRYPDYKTQAVLAVLDQAAQQCKSPDNRRAAANLKKKLSCMAVGKPVSALSFQDLEGKNVSLADFKGKYVYLNFWTTMCAPCTQDMTLIPELKKAYGGKIIFVSVSIDKKRETVKNFLKKNPKMGPDKNGPGWVMLHCDNYRNVKEEFNVLSVPTYYLIDPKGNVFRSPAARPADVEPDMVEIKKRR